MVGAREFLCFPRWCASPLLLEVILLGKVMLEEIQRKLMSLDRPRKKARRIWAGVTKKDQKAELKTKQTLGR